MTYVGKMFGFRFLSSAALTAAMLNLIGCGSPLPASRADPLESSGSEGDNDLLRPFATETGRIQTFSSTGEIDTENPFFQSLGTNGRSCSSCHQASDAWTITPGHVQGRFNATDGLDPIFRKVDGS